MTDVTAIQDEVQEVPPKIHQLRWASLRKRMGRFKITAVMLEDRSDAVLAIMGECIVTRCEHRWDADIFDYTAASWQFREVEEGEMSPEYVWEKDKGGTWIAKEEVTR